MVFESSWWILPRFVKWTPPVKNPKYRLEFPENGVFTLGLPFELFLHRDDRYCLIYLSDSCGDLVRFQNNLHLFTPTKDYQNGVLV